MSVTALGQLPQGKEFRRDGAQRGADIWVSGTLGHAAGALQLWQREKLDVTCVAADPALEYLRQRLLRPTPRVELATALRGIAAAAVELMVNRPDTGNGRRKRWADDPYGRITRGDGGRCSGLIAYSGYQHFT
ncbi:hypothetical protein [Stenotrophomonas sp. SORGH_AS_0321]|uniref:hypothetical protein n=1 Tax=Stenotrophomonas sp. SORGH_AS_0321 TaxID=3041787 RepID=UPI002856491E|nr:hypothetical protein [Stenotrophomonas sp. SORGH_AS_0321]MDR6095779.1 hypothetical protein [Stenotrophomonas sp. SORGH_AS_0321]